MKDPNIYEEIAEDLETGRNSTDFEQVGFEIEDDNESEENDEH